MESAAVRSLCFAESGGAGNQDISADICKEVDRLARRKAALCRGLAELGVKNGLEEGVKCELDGGEKAVEKRKSGVWG